MEEESKEIGVDTIRINCLISSFFTNCAELGATTLEAIQASKIIMCTCISSVSKEAEESAAVMKAMITDTENSLQKMVDDIKSILTEQEIDKIAEVHNGAE